MFSNIVQKFFGSNSDRIVASMRADVDAINALETQMQALSDEGLKERTHLFKKQIAEGVPSDKLLVEAFATVREASVRVLGMRHFDVQLIGGIALNQGYIAEMKTGEGKTLVATLAAYLNALAGKGVHVVTVNDYLARRDGQWMGQLYSFLGMDTGILIPDSDSQARRAAYESDITYGTNNEFGFDYLRDNLRLSLDAMVQRSYHYAIIDEVDSILIDEARTPLIISGPSDGSSDLYSLIDKLIPHLGEGDYEKDEKSRSVSLSEQGQETIEKLLRKKTSLLKETGLYDIENVSVVHHVDQALRAHKLFERDVHYIVRNKKITIIDEFTGRMMEGRRFSDGLHQALEAKERVPIQKENQTLASVTFQNYFRMYPKLAGMTGTAMTEAAEFEEIYKLKTLEIPTHMPMVRKDYDDQVYRTSKERDLAVLAEIIKANTKGQPVLVGTVSIENSESFSKLLKKNNIKHDVLNARNHENEAGIIADAGCSKAVTIATNMAGRGTDIQLGGNCEMRLIKGKQDNGGTLDHQAEEQIKSEIAIDKQKVIAAGGLYIIGTQRHESRRIDNQLRGRSGRQGDTGETKFFLSLEDDLMRIFGSERMEGMLAKLGLEDGEAITHPWVSKALEKAQEKVESRNFEIRKQLLKYDDVMNDQRTAIFSQRRELMEDSDIATTVIEMREESIEALVNENIAEDAMREDWDLQALTTQAHQLVNIDLPIDDWVNEDGVAESEIKERIIEASNAYMKEKEERFGVELMRRVERDLLLRILDHQWKEHLLNLDHLRQGIGLRAYGQRDPLNEYKQESFAIFERMLAGLRSSLTRFLSHVELHQNEGIEQQADTITQKSADVGMEHSSGDVNNAPVQKVGRNSPCPCGSQKKYKHCHGKL